MLTKEQTEEFINVECPECKANNKIGLEANYWYCAEIVAIEVCTNCKKEYGLHLDVMDMYVTSFSIVSDEPEEEINKYLSQKYGVTLAEEKEPTNGTA